MARPSLPSTSKHSSTHSRSLLDTKSSKYLEQKDVALELAASIVQGQEEKARKKVEKNRSAHAAEKYTTIFQKAAKASDRRDPGDTPSKSSSKARLKDKKAAITAQRLHSKKEKAKARKKVSKGVTTGSKSDSPVIRKSPGIACGTLVPMASKESSTLRG
ncbi:uncharacterized protein STEHIDRAFT_114267 [Stereum hirsutum FP-91666 SS1]|uniref:uncharacterized protein n=1 Tax=Stereum hirsutum (strain FP-91666) TaxID=721885 RepID=UPI00044498A0|nr:uncharacterized protein STEHIDRAFT_114267 [Stereum hirsutum FP-91666 SS1]EIM82331.1 hypothetical protein STEHIDRAFT_114267 [Stereum hirsutum FP-91666 SS1]